MDPATGTFTSMDTYGGSLTDPMSLHKYLFANSNPVMYSDPSGHFSLVEFELSEAIDEILMSSISFGMAYIGMVQDNQNLSETEKLTGYFAALGLGALFPFGVALLQAILPVLVAGLALAVLSLALSLTSQFAVDHEKHPIAGALLDITAGAAWGASLSCLGSAFASNARKSSELIHIEADSNATGDGCNWDDIDQEIDDWYPEQDFRSQMSPEEAARYDEYFQLNAPDNYTPNARIDWYKEHNGTIEKSRVIYDYAGRQKYRVDYSTHGRNDHSNPHLHERLYGRGYDATKGKEIRYDFF